MEGSGPEGDLVVLLSEAKIEANIEANIEAKLTLRLYHFGETKQNRVKHRASRPQNRDKIEAKSRRREVKIETKSRQNRGVEVPNLEMKIEASDVTTLDYPYPGARF